MVFWIVYSNYDRCFHAELINESRYCMPLAGPWVVAQIKSGRGYVELCGERTLYLRFVCDDWVELIESLIAPMRILIPVGQSARSTPGMMM